MKNEIFNKNVVYVICIWFFGQSEKKSSTKSWLKFNKKTYSICLLLSSGFQTSEIDHPYSVNFIIVLVGNNPLKIVFFFQCFIELIICKLVRESVHQK